MSGKTDGVDFGFLEEIVGVGHGLGGVNDDEAVRLMDFFDEVFEIGELAAIKISGAVDDNERIFEG